MVDPLFHYTVYRNPTDYPDALIVRRAKIGPGTIEHERLPFMLGPNTDDVLATIRRELGKRGLVNLGRQPNDDPVIVECWI